MEVIFEADARDGDMDAALASLDARMQTAPNPYTDQIVAGVTERSERIDEILATHAQGWTLDRMPAVDRAILRVGTWELLWSDVPEAVAIAEAVQLANELSTEESGKYVNGVLSRVKSLKPRLAVD